MNVLHDGTMRLLNIFTKIGDIQYSEHANAKLDAVEISTLLQRNYCVIEHEKVTLSRDAAVFMALAILAHYGESM